MTEIPSYVKTVLETLEAAGHQAWCVGGCVRDRLLGRTPPDWDVTTDALPGETLALFSAIPTGLQHGTVTVRADRHRVEVTTYRVDGAYLDHRRPDTVTFTASLAEDLQRRDFTVNAMACNLKGELVDLFGGREDLTAGILRCVGEPDQRFGEDALRMLRCLRFAAVLGFAIDSATAESIHRNCRALTAIAPERIQAEWGKLLMGADAAAVLREYPDVIGVFWPEILPMVGFDQKNHHHCFDVWEHTLHALAATPADLVLRYAVLLHDVGKPNSFTMDSRGCGHFYHHPKESGRLAEEMLRRLKLDNTTRKTVVRLVEWHDRDIPRTDRGLRRALLALGEEDLRRLLAVKRADNKGQARFFWATQKEIDKAEDILNRLLAEAACFSLKQLAVRGDDLTQLGLTGRAVGQTLERLLRQVVDGELPNERTALLEYAQREVLSK
ncbi:MAG: HD domain-containing protein [Oscillibacter sp.]